MVPESRPLTVEARWLGTRDPAVGVRVLIGDRAVLTDAEGRATAVVPLGDAVVRGVEPPSDPVAVGADTAQVTLWLDPDARTDEAVGRYRSGPVSTSTALDRETIRGLPGSLGDPVRALQALPGVARPPFESGWLLVRGGEPEDSAVVLRGVPLPGLYHIGGFTSILHPEMVERVDLWPDTPPARYAHSLAGVAEVVPRAPTGQLRLVGGANVVFAHAFAEVPTGPSRSLMVSARRSWLDGALTLALDAERARIAPRFWDAAIRWAGPRTEVMATGSDDSIDLPAEGIGSVPVHQRAAAVHARLTTPMGGGEAFLTPWIGLRDLAIDAVLDSRSLTVEGGLLGGWERELGPVLVKTGLEGRFRHIRLESDRVVRTGPTASVDPWIELSTGEQVEARLVARAATLWAGGQPLRAAPVLRAHLGWSPSRELSLTGDLGWEALAPRPSLLIGQPEGRYLGFDRSVRGAIGLTWARDGLSLGLTGYAAHWYDLSDFEPDGSIGTRAGLSAGFEHQGTWRWQPLLLTWKLAWGRSVRRYSDRAVLHPTPWEQPLGITLQGRVDLPLAFEAGLRFRYATGTWLEDEVQTFDILAQSDVTLQPGPNGRLPPFHAVDVRVAWHHTWKPARLDVWLDVLNVYNRRTAEPIYHGIVDEYLPYGIGLPILPVLGFELTGWP